MEALVQNIVGQLKPSITLLTTKDESEVTMAIEAEVMALVRSGQITEDSETVIRLERRIMDRLNREPRPAKGSAEEDEWAVLARYAALLQKQEEEKKALEAQTRLEAIRIQLQEQLVSDKEKKKRKHEAKKSEQKKVEADVKAWRESEVKKRAARLAASEALKMERQAQIEQTSSRQRTARLLRQAADAHALDQAREWAEKSAATERATRAAARQGLERLFESNRAQQQTREHERQAEKELDVKYIEQLTAALERQEAGRQDQLERVRAMQAAQEADAATRPPFKVWVAEEMIERQAKHADAMAAVKEAERAAAAAAVVQNCVAEVAIQLQEHQAAKEAAAKAKAAEKAAAAVLAAATQAEGAQRTARSRQKTRRFKETLDEQVAGRAAAVRVRSGMSINEKKINSELLHTAEAAVRKNPGATGRGRKN